jgi:integrase
MERHPDGPIFRNHLGKSWTRNALRCRFRRLRKEHPELSGITSYCYRHTFCTDALANGVEVAHVAELLGHTSTDMVMRHYQHLSQRVEHMRNKALQATGANAT